MHAGRIPSNASVSTAVVMLTIRAQKLQLLLVRPDPDTVTQQWILPGARIVDDEDLDESAARGLREQTGIAGIYLEQLYTFRRARSVPRMITVAYFALAPSARLQRDAVATRELHWFDLDGLPALHGDDEAIVTMAHERLAAKLDYSTIAFQFMPETFTLTELQSVYETILREPLDKRNFRKRMHALRRIEDTGETRRNGSHRPARLYRSRYPDRVEFIK